MKKHINIFLVSFVFVMVSACLGSNQTTTPTSTLVPSPFPTLTLTPLPTHTPTATPIPPSISLESQVAPMCEASFSAPILNKPLIGPVMVMLKEMYSTDAQWRYSYLLPYHIAQTATDVRVVFCIQQTRTQTLSYKDGELGYRIGWDIRVIEFPSGDVLAKQTFHGENAPNVKFNNGPGYGRQPTDQLVTWVMKNLEDKTIFFIGESVSVLLFSPDTEYLAVANARRNNVVYSGTTFPAKIFIIDVPTGKIVHTLTGHTDSIMAMAISADGQLLASSSLRNAQVSETLVKIWDMKNGRELHTTKIIGIVTDLAFSTENKVLAVSLWDKTPLIDVTSGKLISEDDPGSRNLFDPLVGDLALETAKRMNIFNPSSEFDVNSPIFSLSPDGSLLAEGSKSGFVKIWNVITP